MVRDDFKSAADPAEEKRQQEIENLPPSKRQEIEAIRESAQRQKEGLNLCHVATNRDDMVRLMRRHIIERYNLEPPALLKTPRDPSEQNRALAAVPDFLDRKNTPDAIALQGRLAKAEGWAKATLAHDRAGEMSQITKEVRLKEDKVVDTHRRERLGELALRPEERAKDPACQALLDQEKAFRKVKELQDRKRELGLSEKYNDRTR